MKINAVNNLKFNGMLKVKDGEKSKLIDSKDITDHFAPKVEVKRQIYPGRLGGPTYTFNEESAKTTAIRANQKEFLVEFPKQIVGKVINLANSLEDKDTIDLTKEKGSAIFLNRENGKTTIVEPVEGSFGNIFKESPIIDLNA